MARSGSQVEGTAVPSAPEPAPGDMQRRPPKVVQSNATTPSPIVVPHVLSPRRNSIRVDLYSVGGSDRLKTPTQPFTHSVVLEGETGERTSVQGLFDDGAMVNSICREVFERLKPRIGPLRPSSRTLRMADGTLVPSSGSWEGGVHLGGRRVEATFEVFPSGGGWSLLAGKPLLLQFEAVHDYGRDILMIPSSSGWITLENMSLQPQTRSGKIQGGDNVSPSRQVSSLTPERTERTDEHVTREANAGHEEEPRDPPGILESVKRELKLGERRGLWAEHSGSWRTRGEHALALHGGNDLPPSRQVPSPNSPHVVGTLGDNPSPYETVATAPDPETSAEAPRLFEKRLRGRRARRNKQRKRAEADSPPEQTSVLRKWWDSVWTVRDTAPDSVDDPGDPQPDLDLGADRSLFTRASDPFNPRRVQEVMRQISIGPDLSKEQHDRVRQLLMDHADCFALSVREVLPIPGATHKIHIPADATFPKKIPHQRQLTEAQRAYLSDSIDELLEGDIIEAIRPEDVKCASPITLAKKVHDNPGLSLDELRHRVNEECIRNGMAPAHDVEMPPHVSQPGNDREKAQKWRICQNYGALNRVTQVFPMPQGDIRTKQRRLSGHRWVTGFDFASGFYAVTIPEESRPYLAYYVEGRGFFTNKRMPFGLTGAPSTFAQVTADALGDLLAKLEIELLVDDGGMGGDDFEGMFDRTHQLLRRVREAQLSLSAKKSQFFMTEIVFAGSRVGPDGVQIDATKLTAIVDWRQPPDLLNLSRFLGLAGYFRDLVKGYAKIAQPLSDLLRSAAIPKGAGKSAYRAALLRVKLPNVWTTAHATAFVSLKNALTSDPVLQAPRFDGTPFIVTSDGCQEGFGAMLAQRVTETRPGGKVVQKLHPIAYASKRTSAAEAKYKPFMLEFAALKFSLDKFDDIIWGFPVEIETDCQALRDVLLSDELNATHARWRDGVIAHQIIDVRHIPGRINLVGDGLSRKDEDLPHLEGDGSAWSVSADWESARGLHYDLFSVVETAGTEHSLLRERFKGERAFVEVIDALLGITGASSEAERKRAEHKAQGYMVEGSKLWRIGGPSPTRSVARRECVTKEEATDLARREHAKLHMGREHIRVQLLNTICSPLLDASITAAIRECGRCKNFGGMHLHALLAPITRRYPFELLVGDYLSMPTGKGGFTKIGLYADVFSQKLFAFKSKAAAGRNTVDGLRRIVQPFLAPSTFMADGGTHFDCHEVRDYCTSIGTKLHIVAAYGPWLNGLLEGSNRIVLNALKRAGAPDLGEDDYAQMKDEDVARSWPDHLDEVIENLNNRVLPALGYSPNELFLGHIVNSRAAANPEDVRPPSDEDVAIHLALVEQQRLDGYAAMVDHAIRRKTAFDARLLKHAPGNVVFQPGDLVQVHNTEWNNKLSSLKKLVPMWTIPNRISTRLLNSYTLETLGGLPVAGLFNARRLRLFEPRMGTRLAMEEWARLEELETSTEPMDNTGEVG